MLLRSSRNCFAAASISMQQFHQTRFFRKTFCQRLIERCQTWWRKAKARLGENTANGEVEWIQNGRFENGLFFKDFSRRSGGSRFPRFSIIFPGIPEIGGQILKTPMVIKPSNQSKPALSLM
jgi:hypothetical protein